jgi:predicted ATPase
MGSKRCLIISGPAGSGKTELLKSLQKAFGGVYVKVDPQDIEAEDIDRGYWFIDCGYTKDLIQAHLTRIQEFNKPIRCIVFATQDKVSKADFTTTYDLEILNLRGRTLTI